MPRVRPLLGMHPPPPLSEGFPLPDSDTVVNKRVVRNPTELHTCYHTEIGDVCSPDFATTYEMQPCVRTDDHLPSSDILCL